MTAETKYHVGRADPADPLRVRVTPGERTCRQCGETLAAGDSYCWSCDNDDPAQFVDTLNYLREDEYEVR